MSQAFDVFMWKCEEISQKSNVQLPKEIYRFAPHVCWKCGEEILVFIWPEDSSMEKAPWTVQKRFSKTADSEYIANTCPYCKSIQGDFFLHHEPDGPFFGFQINADADFEHDLKELASKVVCNREIFL